MKEGGGRGPKGEIRLFSLSGRVGQKGPDKGGQKLGKTRDLFLFRKSDRRDRERKNFT